MDSNNTGPRLVLVTGGIGGIGTAVCRELARRGCRVVAAHLPAEAELARDWQAARRDEDFDIALAAGDLSEFESSKAMVEDVISRFGPISILVNCAGITRDKTLRKMEAEHWQAVLRTNLDSIFNVTRHVVDCMVEQEFGRIVSISSVNGQKGQFGQTNYSAAKAGVHGFTMALAQEVARHGVTVNTVSPGYIDTDMTRAMPAEIREQTLTGIPAARIGEPQDVAHAIAFLADDATSYITGANLPVNGGMYMS